MTTPIRIFGYSLPERIQTSRVASRPGSLTLKWLESLGASGLACLAAANGVLSFRPVLEALLTAYDQAERKAFLAAPQRFGKAHRRTGGQEFEEALEQRNNLALILQEWGLIPAFHINNRDYFLRVARLTSDAVEIRNRSDLPRILNSISQKAARVGLVASGMAAFSKGVQLTPRWVSIKQDISTDQKATHEFVEFHTSFGLVCMDPSGVAYRLRRGDDTRSLMLRLGALSTYYRNRGAYQIRRGMYEEAVAS